MLASSCAEKSDARASTCAATASKSDVHCLWISVEELLISLAELSFAYAHAVFATLCGVISSTRAAT